MPKTPPPPPESEGHFVPAEGREIFDEAILPILRELSRLTASCNMSMIAMVAFSEEEFGSVVSIPQGVASVPSFMAEIADSLDANPDAEVVERSTVRPVGSPLS